IPSLAMFGIALTINSQRAIPLHVAAMLLRMQQCSRGRMMVFTRLYIRVTVSFAWCGTAGIWPRRMEAGVHAAGLSQRETLRNDHRPIRRAALRWRANL